MRIPLVLLSLAALSASSCSSVPKVTSSVKRASGKVQGVASHNVKRLKNLRFTGLPGFGKSKAATPPIVAVRREDLREVKSGEEVVKALKKKQGVMSPIAYLPDDFDPSKLPLGDGLPAAGILPPLNAESIGSTTTEAGPDLEIDLPTPAVPAVSDLPVEPSEQATE